MCYLCSTPIPLRGCNLQLKHTQYQSLPIYTYIQTQTNKVTNRVLLHHTMEKDFSTLQSFCAPRNETVVLYMVSFVGLLSDLLLNEKRQTLHKRPTSLTHIHACIIYWEWLFVHESSAPMETRSIVEQSLKTLYKIFWATTHTRTAHAQTSQLLLSEHSGNSIRIPASF